jgi:hypothetical protein
MKVTREQVRAALDPGVAGRGAARALRVLGSAGGQRTGPVRDDASMLSEAVLAAPKPPRRARHWNPAKATAVRGRQAPDSAAEEWRLEPADLAWLGLLPADPTHVADRDVERLSELWDLAEHPSDVALLRAHFAPVARLHAEVEARAAVDAAEADAARAPSREAVDAAVRVIVGLEREETPGLSDDEVHARAKAWVDGEVARAASERQARLEKSSATLKNLPDDVLPPKSASERRSAMRAAARIDGDADAGVA